MGPVSFGRVRGIQGFVDIGSRRKCDFGQGFAIDRSFIDKIISFNWCNPIAANEVVYLTDNELTSSSSTAFNTGESYTKWTVGATPIPAGTVVVLDKFDTTPTISIVGTVLSGVAPSWTRRPSGFSFGKYVFANVELTTTTDGECSVSDFSAPRTAHKADFANAERREIVVQHESLGSLS